MDRSPVTHPGPEFAGEPPRHGRHRGIIAISAAVSTLGVIAAFAATRPDAPTRPAVEVALAGFRGAIDRDAEPPFAAAWSGTLFPEIRSADDCARLWRTHRVLGGAPGDGLQMRTGFGDTNADTVSTCEEWMRARDAGRFAATTFDITMQSQFEPWLGVMQMLPHVQPCERSTFRGLDLAAFTLDVLPQGIDPLTSARAAAPDQRWTVEGNTMKRVFGTVLDWLEPIALGDLDGDGWDDLLASHGGAYLEGSGRWYGTTLLARRADGRLIDISGRLPGRMVDEATMDARRAGWNANFGLPAGTELVLEGTCECCDSVTADRRHRLTATMRFDRGYASGRASCARGRRDVPIAGVLATKEAGSLHEYGPDGRWVSTIEFAWSLADGTLSIEGLRLGVGQTERDGWAVRGGGRR